jgi:hypothetical protein
MRLMRPSMYNGMQGSSGDGIGGGRKRSAEQVAGYSRYRVVYRDRIGIGTGARHGGCSKIKMLAGAGALLGWAVVTGWNGPHS